MNDLLLTPPFKRETFSSDNFTAGNVFSICHNGSKGYKRFAWLGCLLGVVYLALFVYAILLFHHEIVLTGYQHYVYLLVMMTLFYPLMVGQLMIGLNHIRGKMSKYSDIFTYYKFSRLKIVLLVLVPTRLVILSPKLIGSVFHSIIPGNLVATLVGSLLGPLSLIMSLVLMHYFDHDVSLKKSFCEMIKLVRCHLWRVLVTDWMSVFLLVLLPICTLLVGIIWIIPAYMLVCPVVYLFLMGPEKFKKAK